MRNKKKIIWVLFILLTVFSFSQKIKKYIFDKDYYVYMNPVCTGEYSCFMNEESENPYLKVYRKAYSVEACISNNSCQPDLCQPDEKDCMIITCSEDTIEEGEYCMNLN